jgi:hypothetical protein
MFLHKLVFDYFQYTRFQVLEKQGNLKSGLLDLDGIKLHFYESQNEGRPILFLQFIYSIFPVLENQNYPR